MLFLTFSIVFGYLSNFISTTFAEDTNSTLKVDLQIINLKGDGTINHESEFWVKTPVEAAADISVSGTGSKIQDPWVVVTVPKSNIATKPTFVDSQNAYQSLRLEDESNYYILYKFNEIAGGMRSTFPFPFEFNEEPTNNGDTLTVKMDVIDAKTVENKKSTDSAEMLSLINTLPKLYSTQKTYKALKNQLEITISRSLTDKIIMSVVADSTPDSSGNSRTTSDIHDIFIPISSADITGTTKENVPIRLSYGVNTDGVTGTISYRKAEYIESKVLIPDGATLSEASIKAGWVYNPDEKTATRRVDNPSFHTAWLQYYNGPRITDLSLDFSVPFEQVYSIPTEFKVKYPNEEVRELTDLTLRVRFKPMYFNRTGNFQVYKDNLTLGGTIYDNKKYYIYEGNYAYYNGKLNDILYDHTEKGMVLTQVLKNSNNGSSYDNAEGGVVSNVFAIEDVLSNTNEHKIYYNTFKIDSVSSNNSDVSKEIHDKHIEDVKTAIDDNSNVLYGVTDSGEKIEIARDIKFGQEVDINDTELRFAKLSLEFENPITLDNVGITNLISVKLSDEEAAKFENRDYLNRQYYRGATNALVSTSANPATNTEEGKIVTDSLINRDYTSISVDTISPRSDIWNSVSKPVLPYNVSGTFLTYGSGFNLKQSNGLWGDFINHEFKDVKIIQLLPQGFNYVSTERIGKYKGKLENPEVITNYKNTGRTAVVYTVPKMLASDSTLDGIEIFSNIEATPYVERGNNTFETFAVYDSNGVVLSLHSSGTYKDALDLDSDGNREEVFARSSEVVNYIPPLELLIKKTVGLSKDNLGLLTTGDLGYEFIYGINIFNNTIADNYKAYVIDVLPYVGDHSIVPNQNSVYTPRKSDFPVTLSKAIEDVEENRQILDSTGRPYIERFDILYQLTSQGDDLESVRDGQWVTKEQVSDFSKVKSFKLKLKDGEKIASKEDAKIVVKAVIPYDTNLTPEEDFAVNSTALSTDDAIYSEANSVKTTFTTYSVSGIVFNDVNLNGTKDSTESLVEGTKVELIDSNTGDVALDYKNNPIAPVMTDSNGSYQIKVYKRGDYKVRFTLPDGSVFSTGNGNGVNDNNIVVTDNNVSTPMETTVFSLQPTTNANIKNAAIYLEKRNIKIIKESDVVGIDGTYKKLRGAKFTLTEVLENTTEGVTPKEFTAVTEENGELVFSDVPFGKYLLKETESPTGYSISETLKNGIEIVVNRDELAPITLKNTPNKGSIKITKVDRITGDILIDGTTFELYLQKISNGENNDTVVSWMPVSDADGNVRTATTDKNGVAIFDNLFEGMYRLIEKVSNIGYILPTGDDANTDVDLKLSKDGEVVDQVIKNSKKTGSVTIKKIDAETNEPIQNVKFEIRQNLEDGSTKDVSVYTDNKEKAIAITNENGVASFTNIPYGANYSIYEIEAPEQYVVNKEKLEFNLNGSQTKVSSFDITENGQNIDLGEVTNTTKKGIVTLKKVDADDSSKALSGVKFALKQGDKEVYTATSNDSGIVEFDNVVYGEYELVEKETIDGYVVSPQKITVKIDSDGKIIDLGTVKNSKLINISGEKVWVDYDNKFATRPENINVSLKQDGKVIKTETVTGDSNKWSFKFENYPEYEVKEDGTSKKYTYEVVEETVNVNESAEDAEGEYVASYAGDSDVGFTITNTFVNTKKTSVNGVKTWNDDNDRDGKRPDSIIVNLLADGKNLDSKTVTAGSDDVWSYLFEGLQKYNSLGDLIKYSITENSVENYSTEINGTDITNSYTPDKTSVTVTKNWDDDNNRDGIRPDSVEVELLANGEVVEDSRVTLNEANKWTNTWSDLFKKSKVDGVSSDIKYTVKEVSNVEGYTTSIDDSDHGNIIVTNTHEPEKTTFTTYKVWDDTENQDGFRPKNVKVYLKTNDVISGDEVVLDEGNKWTHIWDNLYKYSEGKEIKYSVSEISVDKYSVSYKEVDSKTVEIKNTHKPESISLSGTKTWEDKDNKSGNRPEKITVRLLADNVEVAKKDVTKDEKWSFNFDNLPKYKDGKEIVYTISEDSVPYYTPSYNGMDITNKYTPNTTYLTVRKIWKDENDYDKIRPKSVKIALLVNGVESGEEVELNEQNNWTSQFKDLDTKINNKDAVYSVVEKEVPNSYTVDYSYNNNTEVSVTNEHKVVKPTSDIKKSTDTSNNVTNNVTNNETNNTTNNVTNNTTNNVSDNISKNDSLPQTGDSNMSSYLGIILLAISILLLKREKGILKNNK